jgi:hypothetical protein
MRNLRQSQTKNTKANSKSQTSSGVKSDRHPVEDIQSVIGNRAFGKLLHNEPTSLQLGNSLPKKHPSFKGLSHELGNNLVQTKLKVNEPGDKYEQEADQVASQVVKQINSNSPEEFYPSNNLMRKSHQAPQESDGGMVATPELESAIQQKQGKGQPLPDKIQGQMENAFGADFSNVRVHTDSQSDRLNRSLQARAFTNKQDIFFQKGAYQPQSKQGQELLAHELTHVVQQNQNNCSVQRDTVVQRDETPLYAAEQGRKSSNESKSRTATNPGVVTSTEKKLEGFAGAEFAVKKITKASDDAVKTAFEVMARSGAFGEATAKKAVDRGKLKYGAEGSAKGGAGIQAEGKLTTEVLGVIEGITILFEGSAKAGISGDLKGEIYASAGFLKAELQAKLSGFAGAMAEAKGEIQLGILKGIVLSGSVSATAGVQGSAEATVKIGSQDFGVEGKITGEAFAGAKAEAEGEVSISLFSADPKVALSGRAEAFAGAKVEASASGTLQYKSKALIKISGKLVGEAGVGGELEAGIEYSNGKLTIKGEAAAALGLGGGAGVTVEVDFKEISQAVVLIVKQALLSKAEINRLSLSDDDREMMPPEEKAEMQKKLYDAVFPPFYAYGWKKWERTHLKKDSLKGKILGAEHYVKREAIQEIIDEEILTKPEFKDLLKYKESDIILTRAAYDAFGEQLQPHGITIQAGIIRVFYVKKIN